MYYIPCYHVCKEIQSMGIFFKINLCVCVGVHAPQCACEGQSLSFPLTMWVLKTDLRSSGLTADTFICCLLASPKEPLEQMLKDKEGDGSVATSTCCTCTHEHIPTNMQSNTPTLRIKIYKRLGRLTKLVLLVG